MIRMITRVFWLCLLVVIAGCSSGSSSSPQLVAITIQAADVIVPLGGTYQFSAIGSYSDGSSVNLTSTAVWSSSQASVATVSNLAGSNGLATSVAGGSTTIRATYGGLTASTSLMVVPIGGSSQGAPLVLSGLVSTIAGNAALAAGAIDAVGVAARFSLPVGITTDGKNLYIADATNNTIRTLVIASGLVSTLAGSAGQAGTTDGSGGSARFFSPRGITTDGSNLYVAEMQSHTIRKIVIASGAVTTLAGSAGAPGSSDAVGAAARFNSPTGITTDGINLYVTDTGNHTIRKIVIASGAVTTLAGSAGAPGATDASGIAARFSQPVGITMDGFNLYVADFGNSTIRRVVIATAGVSTLAGSPGLPGSVDGSGSAARFTNPATGITTDGTNLYVSDYGNHTIRSIVIATGVVTTLAGSAGLPGSSDGSGSVARCRHPEGLTSDGRSLFIADSDNNTIRKMQ